MKTTKKQMTKLLMVLLTGVIFTAGLSGAYLQDLPIQLIQPDGEVIDCFASGDEFFNYAHTEDGYTIIVGADGYYYYAVNEGEDVVASAYRVNSVNPATVGIPPKALISERLYRERREAFHVPLERNDTRAPHTGEMNNLVVYIRFSDDTDFIRNVSYYDQRLNNLNGQSVRDYFIEVSYNQLDIISHHYPEPSETGAILSYQDTYPRDHFRPYHAVNNPDGYRDGTQRRLREHSMLVRAIQAVRTEIPEDLVIDADNDGRVDNVCFIIRGNSGAWADLLWAHRWVLHSYDVRIHGKRVYDYTFQPENQAGASTLSHEMFHTLGAPDLYRYTQSSVVPVGSWDLMASGFVHMGAWMKYKYANRNWITHIPEINTSGEYSLKPLTSPTNNAFFIRSPYSNRQFFVLEYRKREGRYESGVPGSGLIVYRINTAVDGNASGPPDEVYVYRPNGTTTVNGQIGQAHYNSTFGRTEINDFNSNPTSFLANGNPGGLHIFDVGAAGDSITFSVNMIGDLVAPILDRPANFATNVGLMPTFEWGYVNVAEYYSLQVATDSLFTEPIINETNITETEFAVTQGLEIEQTYFWRVNSSDDEDTSEWSKPWEFTVSHFTLLQLSAAGAAYGDITWGDLNNNGFQDLIVTGEDRTVVYRNTGDGSFELIDTELPPLRRSSVALADVNRNGLLDVILTGRNPENEPRAYVCINGGNFTFGALDGGMEGAYNGNIAVGDFNNNGLPDIFVVGDSEEGHSARLYENSGDYIFTPVTTAELPGMVYGDAAWADFNNNGRLDLVLSGQTRQGGKSEIFYNNGDGTFTQANTGMISLSGSSLDVGDYNNDGYIDIVLSGSSTSGPGTFVYRNNGDGTFTRMEFSLPGTALGEVKWGDLNGNGYLDLLITGSNSSRVFRNINGESFVEVVAGMDRVSFSASAWADYDNDGDLDVAIAGAGINGPVLQIYRNNIGSNTAVANTPPTTPGNPQAFVNQCSVSLIWESSTDAQTPETGITYNVSIGTSPGAQDYMSSLSNLDNGFRLITERGNVGYMTDLHLLRVPIGDYYWRVQAVDGSFSGSPFTAEGSFSVATVSVDDSETDIAPAITELGTNYPNPFNPETTIRFALAEQVRVKLEVYNIMGQQIAVLIDDELAAGQHSVVWNARTEDEKLFPSGIYLYRMQAGEYKSIKRMLLLK